MKCESFRASSSPIVGGCRSRLHDSPSHEGINSDSHLCHQSSQTVCPVACPLTLVFVDALLHTMGISAALFGLSPTSACKVGLTLPANAAVFACYDSDGHRWYHVGGKRHDVNVMPFPSAPLAPRSPKWRLVEQDQVVGAPGTLVFGWRPPHTSGSPISKIALGRPMVPEPILLIGHPTRLPRAVPRRLGAGEVLQPQCCNPPPPRR